MAKHDEVAHSFQPLMGAHGGQVADPVIEASDSIETDLGQRVLRHTPLARADSIKFEAEQLAKSTD
jgi:hypothetical protein